MRAVHQGSTVRHFSSDQPGISTCASSAIPLFLVSFLTYADDQKPVDTTVSASDEIGVIISVSFSSVDFGYFGYLYWGNFKDGDNKQNSVLKAAVQIGPVASSATVSSARRPKGWLALIGKGGSRSNFSQSCPDGNGRCGMPGKIAALNQLTPIL